MTVVGVADRWSARVSAAYNVFVDALARSRITGVCCAILVVVAVGNFGGSFAQSGVSVANSDLRAQVRNWTKDFGAVASGVQSINRGYAIFISAWVVIIAIVGVNLAA